MYLVIENSCEWSQTLEEGEREKLKETESWLGKIRKCIRKMDFFGGSVVNKLAANAGHETRL